MRTFNKSEKIGVFPCTRPIDKDLQDYQLRILRNTFRDLVRKDIEETVQRPAGLAGPVGFDPLAKLLYPEYLR